MAQARVQLAVTGEAGRRRGDVDVLLAPEVGERFVCGVGRAAHAIEELHRTAAVQHDEVGASYCARSVYVDQPREARADSLDTSGEFVEPVGRGTRDLENR